MSKLTFVIPAFNAAATLAATLDSLVAQTRGDWRAIVVDDGSADATARVAAGYGQRDPRITSLSTANQGVCRARNTGLAQVETPWVAFLDADDRVASTYVEKMLEPTGDARSWDAIYCGYRRVTPEGGAAATSFDPRLAELGFELLARECPVALHCMVVRRDRLLAIGGFDPALRTCEDWDLWQRLAREGLRITAVPEVLADYRLSPASLSCDFERMLQDGLTVLRRGYGPDPRVTAPRADLAQRLVADDLASRETFFAAWCGAASVGAGGDGAPMMAGLGAMDDGGQVSALAHTVLAGLMVGARRPFGQSPEVVRQCWTRLEPLLRELARSGVNSAGRGLVYALEREAILAAPEAFTGALFHTAALPLNPDRLSRYTPPDGVDRLILCIKRAGATSARAEIPVFGPLNARDLAEICQHALGERAFLRPAVLASVGFWAAAIRLALTALRQPNGRKRALRRALHEAALARWGAPSGWSLADQVAAAIAVGKTSGPSTSPAPASVSQQGLETGERRAVWEAVFAEADPWDYSSEYETEKYDLTLDVVMRHRPSSVLELACAEGRFTQRLAEHVGAVTAADISSLALTRAAERCAGFDNIAFQILDLVDETIPAGQEMIICSEVLYYLPDRGALAEVARKLAEALADGGRLVMANHFLLKDDPSVTGFDWDQAYGAKVVHEAFAARPELVLESSLVTELYRIDCFRRAEGDRVPQPQIVEHVLKARIEPRLERFIVRGGAVALKGELLATTQSWDVPVLAYHRVADDGPAALSPWRVTPQAFEAQMRLLRRHGYYTVTPEQMLQHMHRRAPLPGRPVLITFDDAYQDFADAAWPVLQACGFGATVFAVVDRVGDAARWDADAGPPARLMDSQTIVALSGQGVSFGSHLASHAPAPTLSSRALLDEVVRSKAQLEAWTGGPVRTIAAPYGAVDERYHRTIAVADLSLGFTSDPGTANLWAAPGRTPRLEVRGDWSMADFAAALGLEPDRIDTSQDSVAVVIPAYNAAQTIDATLTSVRNQTHARLEILVIDDGSKDDTVERVQAHVAQDPRVRLLRQPNAGVAAARNHGIQACRSELVAPVDADDLWAPDKIERQLQALYRGGPRVALVYSWYAVIDQEGRVVETSHRPRDAGDVLARMCRGNLIGNGSSPLMRKAAVLEAGGYCSRLREQRAQGCEDLLLYFRIAERHDFAVVPAFLTGYRRLPEAMSADVTQMLRSYRLVGQEMRRKYPRHAQEVRRGEIELAAWLFWKATRNRQPGAALELLAEIARLDARHAARTAVGLARKGLGRLGGLKRRGSPPPPLFSQAFAREASA
jgi:glycosyltransferase involved in cell wall biosynthesis/peptidoglycan/xylan/chitin deacetylase (PgdA/CDA1 family)/SAM-dependent methyltransferase